MSIRFNNDSLITEVFDKVNLMTIKIKPTTYSKADEFISNLLNRPKEDFLVVISSINRKGYTMQLMIVENTDLNTNSVLVRAYKEGVKDVIRSEIPIIYDVPISTYIEVLVNTVLKKLGKKKSCNNCEHKEGCKIRDPLARQWMDYTNSTFSCNRWKPIREKEIK